MKNCFKIFVLVIISLITTLTFADVYAVDGLTLTRQTYIQTGSRSEAKFYTSKGYGYCITPEKVGANQGTSFSYSKTETDGGLLYLLEKGGSSDSVYLTTQLAIWKYRSNFIPDAYYGTSVYTKAVSLANDASKHSNYTGVIPSISITNNNSVMSLSSDGKYYQSSYMSVNMTGSNTYVVSVNNSNFEIVNSKGNVVTDGQFNKADKFYIRIKEEKVTSTTSVKINVKAIGYQNIVRRYTPIGVDRQDLVVLEKISKTLTDNTSLSVTPVKRVCEYHNGKYYDKAGNVTTKIKYQQECETNICKVVGDKYFGKDGKETTKVKYQQECETNICKVVGDKYFGKDGKETTKLKYQQECETNICKIVGDKYFGKDGIEVSYEQYKSQCEASEVKVPDTGVNPTKTIISIIIGALIITGTGLFVKRYNK